MLLYRVWHFTTLCDTLDWSTACCTDCGTSEEALVFYWGAIIQSVTHHNTVWHIRLKPIIALPHGRCHHLARERLASLLRCWWYNYSAHCDVNESQKICWVPQNCFLSNLIFPQIFLVLEGGKSCCLKPRRHRPSLLTGFRLTCSFLLSIICNALHFLTSLHMILIDCKSIADP